MTNEISSESVSDPTQSSLAQDEHVIPQSKANKLVGNAREEGRQAGYKNGYKQAIDDFQKSQPVSNDRGSFNTENMHGASESNIAKIVSEEIQKSHSKIQEQAAAFQAQQEHQKTINELAGKINDAAKNIPDFADTLSEVRNFADAPALLHYANRVDNAGEVLYELAKHPGKAVQVISAIQAGTSTIAEKLIRDLSKSIKDNNQASGDKLPDEPLSQLRPSNIGIGKAHSDTGSLVNKFRGKY